MLPFMLFFLLLILPLNRRSDILLEEVEEALHIPHLHLDVSTKESASSAPIVVKPVQKRPLDALSIPSYKRENGILYVADKDLKDGIHPIEVLISEAKEQAKIQQSKIPTTLAGAIELYSELNGGALPPKGFEAWFEFCIEYDLKPWPHSTAYNSVLPFLSVEGKTLRENVKALKGMLGISTFQIRKGAISEEVSSVKEHQKKSSSLSLLLQPIAHLLPDLDLYFNLLDQPTLAISESVLEKAKALGRAGKTWKKSELDKVLQPETSKKTHWSDLCKTTQAEESPTLRSFIYDESQTRSPCTHPSLFQLHGHYLPPPPSSNLPLFTPVISPYSAALSPTLLGIPLSSLNATLPHTTFLKKTDKRVIWRGATTGIWHDGFVDWRKSQRERLVFFGGQKAKKDVGDESGGDEQNGRPKEDSEAKDNEDEDEDDGEMEEVLVVRGGRVLKEKTKRELMEDWLDLGFVGSPTRCVEADGTCAEMSNMFNFRSKIEPLKASKFRYQLDVDGDGASTRFRRLLTSGSAVFKSTVFNEWFSDTIIPWYHYVPVQVSYSDLFDITSFFEGVSGSEGQFDLAEEIAHNGREFAISRWGWKDMQAYLLLLLLEYNRALSDDRAAATAIDTIDMSANFPEELYPLIVSYTTAPNDLRVLSLVSRSWRKYANEVLYSHVWLPLLFRTLAQSSELGQLVKRLEIRSYPLPGIDRSDIITSHTLLSFLSLPNLSSLAWTRHRSLSEGLILAISTSMPFLRDLEINGSTLDVYDPTCWLRVSRLEKLGLIMPDKGMVDVLKEWFRVLDQNQDAERKTKLGLKRLSIICKSSPLIRDHHLKSWAPYLSNLNELSLTACIRISSEGVRSILRSTSGSITHLGLESVENVDILTLDLPALAPSLKYLSYTYPSGHAVCLDDILIAFHNTLETLHLTSPTGRSPISFALPNVLFPNLSLLSLSSKVLWESFEQHSSPNLEQLFLRIRTPKDLNRLGICMGRMKRLRALQILAPPPDEYGWEPSIRDLHTLAECHPTLMQIGIGTRVYQVFPSLSSDHLSEQARRLERFDTKQGSQIPDLYRLGRFHA
ncbi:Endoplasmic reticulum protein EP58, contains filamin rod domain and KDEL motif [Phaffia rhodozyma]|uniref:Endoplasmic reticulum protein EP58, contains filamin rod domain and KDEL motif n=1 Tax=Phaffia rhodozyma TaxID=264483 RepID=A0A0F7SQT6_PHARH|nr:Endoplasmic reticulum protein EP58, contains filamin rod domain and KDEL motif [Phaffia rhodozyma]